MVTLKPAIVVIILTVVASVLAVTTLAAIVVNQNVSSSGNVVTSPNIGVYSDSSCNNNLTTINWGNITAGGTTTQTIYVKNTGTGSMTINLATSNWSPAAASNYITISWNQAGTQLSAGQSVTAIVTLTVASNVTGFTSFSNTITISGVG
jgi:hypothetical protein